MVLLLQTAFSAFKRHKTRREGTKMKKVKKASPRVFAVLLALVLLVGLVPMTARAAHGSLYENNTGSNASNYASGYTTPETALEISSPQDLLDLRRSSTTLVTHSFIIHQVSIKIC
jgi:hypothetical protein